MESEKVVFYTKELLRKLNVRPSLSGYEYWPIAVSLAIKRGCSNCEICKDIYCEIAEKFNKKEASIERCMRTITESRQRDLKKYFKTKSKIRNKDLLVLLVDKVKELNNTATNENV